MEPYFYPGEELSLFEEARNWKKYFSSKIGPYIKGNVLEVGAGIGETTPYLLNKNVKEWTCLEPDARLFSLLAGKKSENKLPANCTLVQGMLDALPAGNRYDTILYIDVLEHIEDDASEIRSALSRLNDNGHLVIISPAKQYLYSPFDKSIGHFRRYNKRTLRKAVDEKRASEVRIFYMEATGMLLLVLNKFLLRKKYPNSTVIKIWDRIFIPASRLIDRILFYSTGKSIIGIWKYTKNDK